MARTKRSDSEAGFAPRAVAEQLQHHAHRTRLRSTAGKGGGGDISGVAEGPRVQKRDVGSVIEGVPAVRRRSLERKHSTPTTPSPEKDPSHAEDPAGALKPGISFASLIKEAILTSPHHRLLLHEIYDSIQRKYPYFRTAGDGWKNSIRHNLSINAMFCKIPRSLLEQEGSGVAEQLGRGRELGQKKGCYWIVKDMASGSTGAVGYEYLEAQRRRTLHHLFARSGSIASQPEHRQHQHQQQQQHEQDVIHILPFTNISMVNGNGERRRMSESALPAQSYAQEPMGSGTEMIWTPIVMQHHQQQEQQQQHGYYPVYPEYQQYPVQQAYQASQDAYFQPVQPVGVQQYMEPIMDMQPLPIEPQMGYDTEQGAEMPWLATSPTMTESAMHEPFLWPVQQQQVWGATGHHQHQPSMRERRASEVGPGKLPRRDPKDVWLSDLGSDKT